MARAEKAQRRQLTRDDWAAAAAKALAAGGVAAVAVEPIAAQLGATKGSFYWHFANREALLRAALEHWEHQHTAVVLAEIDARGDDPLTRLRLLIKRVTEAVQEDRIALALLADADHPIVAPVLRRVTERRVRYTADLLAELGLAPDRAAQRALLAHSAYLGHAYLSYAAPEILPRSRAARSRYLDDVIATLIAR
ncbi:MAG TPA: TetR/AcrR family transcriptional regulator [Micromonosporaceae bacterium]|nr:TetR/AcrR family transcriptional regulator [Micromonosporaceae bacterium]